MPKFNGPELAAALRNTTSRSKRELLDAAADAIERYDAELKQSYAIITECDALICAMGGVIDEQQAELDELHTVAQYRIDQAFAEMEASDDE